MAIMNDASVEDGFGNNIVKFFGPSWYWGFYIFKKFACKFVSTIMLHMLTKYSRLLLITLLCNIYLAVKNHPINPRIRNMKNDDKLQNLIHEYYIVILEFQ